MFNYKCIFNACPFSVMSTWQLEKPTTQLQEIEDTQHSYSVTTHTSTLLFLYSYCLIVISGLAGFEGTRISFSP